MAVAILSKNRVFTKLNSKIGTLLREKEFPMKCKLMHDFVTPQNRLKTPFRYTWLKFKTSLFGLKKHRGNTKCVTTRWFK